MKQVLGLANRMGPLLLMTVVAALDAQQVTDTDFRPPIETPVYLVGKGPVVLIDEAHFNFHTATGRYLPFAELLRRDGYVVQPSAARFTAEVLEVCRVLVISNALNENQNDRNAPALSAFTAQELAAVRDWVAGGGSLLLIADHPPSAGAAEDLGKAFGVRFRNGFAVRGVIEEALRPGGGRLVFRRSDGTLMDHPVTKGIDEVATFTGSSFQVDAPGQPLLVFGPEVYSFAQRNDPNPVSMKGHLQGAVLPFGKGRVAVFGEAAMFSAQLSGPTKNPMGMNAPIAKQNPQFVLNVMHWLTGLL